MKRFQDQGKHRSDFAGHTIVACPSCDKPIDLLPQKLACIHCGFSDTIPSRSRYDLFLRIECCGETLYVNNLEHLDFLEAYVSADLRERTPNINKSQISRLPQWVKSAKHREELLKCIRKARKQLAKSDYKSTFQG